MILKKNILSVSSVIFLVFLCAYLLRAYNLNPNCQKNEKQKIVQPAYEVKVEVTNVEVIITDIKGNRIVGLKPENFEIFEDGTLQKLTNFYEVRGTGVFTSGGEEAKANIKQEAQPFPEGPAQIKNRIIFFFDNWHIHPMNRNWIAKKLAPFIQSSIGKDKAAQGMVIFLDQKLEILQDFTSSPYAIIQAVDSIKNKTGDTLSRLQAREDLQKELNRIMRDTGRTDQFEQYSQSMAYARGFVEEEMNSLSYALKSLDALMSYLSGIDGRKRLIYICDGLPLNPGEKIFSALDESYPFGDARAEAMNYDATDLFKELSARCNAREISIYPIDAERFESQFSSADKDGALNIWARGISNIEPGPREKNASLELLANETGGSAILSANNVEPGLKTIEDDFRYFYSLGYESSHQADDRYHSIDVKLIRVNEKFNLRIRKGYIRSSQEAMLKENVVARLFLQNYINPLDIKVQILPLENMLLDKVKLTLKVLIPINKIALIPLANEYVGKMNIYAALMDSNNQWSDPEEFTQDIKIPDEDYEKALKSCFPYLIELHLRPNLYRISLAIKDVFGSTISYIQLTKKIPD
jgi:VWFA-related protein